MERKQINIGERVIATDNLVSIKGVLLSCNVSSGLIAVNRKEWDNMMGPTEPLDIPSEAIKWANKGFNLENYKWDENECLVSFYLEDIKHENAD